MPKGLREPAEIRFWRFVTKSEGCWQWNSSTNGQDGRAQFDHKAAARTAWELLHGIIPAGRWVLHTCDNPNCVNPDHLYLGDRAQNMRDAHQRGRIDMKRVAAAKYNK